ncbi:TPA: hypothetical protein DEW47_00660 [Patescibacteria group bacterium]|nr:MAG: Acetylornithine deacetylase [Parcubacteria group bacterium GW2011_GWF2_40_10]KKR59930.1 MAG: Acetylornithine deacetylase [Parcubacteria group bacterium GW2011_GWC2_40_31]KKR74217.1 MAG: Acetylornithine deacetylase [Parcubacteria group bacterium GW2011_GWB2_40_8]KKR75434.1 MAG: Acetylornithine deacetylase [Parcubacteria group bacterium GW2011_GWE2_40_8]KKR81977.1 MAG: Acetylornithine deacetylase [Parcubacteria group bacterium GW2011_GWD2_40_9]HBB56541.1 hypothetical protein [Patescibact
MNIEKILERLIKFNTVEDKDNNEIVKWIANFLCLLGFKIELVENKESNKASLFVTIGSKPALTFLGHTDTISAGENWTIDPFAMKIDGDKIYGLGSSDMKGGIASLLSAVSQINFKNCKNGFNLLLTYDEETNFEGITDFMKTEKINTEYVIVGEPTNLEPMIASKGILSFVINFYGKECHGSEPEKGLNAIILACDFIKEIQEYFAGVKDYKNDIFSPNYTTINFGKIKGGDAVNKVPAECVLEVECRTVAEKQNKKIIENFLKIAKKYNARVETKFSVLPVQCDDENFISDIEKITGNKSGSVNYFTDGSFLGKMASKMIILGPGPFNAHKANEWVSKKSLHETEKIYKKIIEKYL